MEGVESGLGTSPEKRLKKGGKFHCTGNGGKEKVSK